MITARLAATATLTAPSAVIDSAVAAAVAQAIPLIAVAQREPPGVVRTPPAVVIIRR
jgi:hypothetical protein